MDDDAAARAGADDDAEDRFGVRRGAVRRFGEREAVGVVGDADRPIERAAEIVGSVRCV